MRTPRRSTGRNVIRIICSILLVSFLLPTPAAADEAPSGDVVLRALLELKKQDGKDNAIIHYRRACQLAPPLPDQGQLELIQPVLDEGWSDEARPLIPYLERWKPAFSEIRAGAATGYARNVSPPGSGSQPAPCYMNWLNGVKALCVRGRYLEILGRHDEALRDHLTSLTMAVDIGVPETTILPFRVSLGFRNIPIPQIERLTRSRDLDRKSLEYALYLLKKDERKAVRLADVIRTEPVPSPGEIIEDAKMSEALFPGRARGRTGDAAENAEQIAKEYRAWLDLMARQFAVPFWERDAEAQAREVQGFLESCHPHIRLANELFEFEEVYVESLVRRAELRLAQLTAALEVYWIDNGEYPAELERLAPIFRDPLPVDPFSGHTFVYHTLEDGGYVLFSVGPDGTDDRVKIEYDSTNGTLSRGDVFFK